MIRQRQTVQSKLIEHPYLFTVSITMISLFSFLGGQLLKSPLFKLLGEGDAASEVISQQKLIRTTITIKLFRSQLHFKIELLNIKISKTNRLQITATFESFSNSHLNR